MAANPASSTASCSWTSLLSPRAASARPSGPAPPAFAFAGFPPPRRPPSRSWPPPIGPSSLCLPLSLCAWASGGPRPRGVVDGPRPRPPC